MFSSVRWMRMSPPPPYDGMIWLESFESFAGGGVWNYHGEIDWLIDWCCGVRRIGAIECCSSRGRIRWYGAWRTLGFARTILYGDDLIVVHVWVWYPHNNSLSGWIEAWKENLKRCMDCTVSQLAVGLWRCVLVCSLLRGQEGSGGVVVVCP